MKKIILITIIGILVFSGLVTGVISIKNPFRSSSVVEYDMVILASDKNFDKINSFAQTKKLSDTKYLLSNKNELTMEENDWFYYAPLDNYAPSGMPDFDQKQNNWKDPVYNGWTFCGTVSVANIFWYIDSIYSDTMGNPGDGKDMFPLVLDYNSQGESNPGPFTDDHNYNNVNDLTSIWNQKESVFGNELIERIAWYVDTNGCRTSEEIWGTNLGSMYLGVRKWLEDVNLMSYFEVETLRASRNNLKNFYLDDNYSPIRTTYENTQGSLISQKDFFINEKISNINEDFTFEYIAERVKDGSFVVLGIVGYDGEKNVHFSHWVTIAGVSTSLSQIALSDPYFDNINNTNDFTLHNDAAIVSHDIYTVNTTSPFPEEADYWWLEEYLPNLYSVIPAAFIITPLTSSIPQILPVSYFIKPDESYFFIKDKHIIPTIFGNTIIVGDITFEANAFSKDGIDRIEFYVNEELKYVDDEFPYVWFWDEQLFGHKMIKISAVDKLGNLANNVMQIWKFF
jgi:hypothetical protein